MIRGFCFCSFVSTLLKDTWVETDAYKLLINTPMILAGNTEAWEISRETERLRYDLECAT